MVERGPNEVDRFLWAPLAHAQDTEPRPADRLIVESDRLVERCRAGGREAERLFVKKEVTF